MFCDPEVLARSAPTPNAVLQHPIELLESTQRPTAVLPIPVVLKRSA